MELNEGQKYIYDTILLQINMGFRSPEEIQEMISEMIQDEQLESEVDTQWAKDKITEAYDERVKESYNSWGYPTDPLLLSDAFDELRSLGIIALHNAGYTTSDGEADVVEIEHALREQGIQSKGYCFYHEQDLERAMNGNLMLAFQKLDNSNPEVTAEIGRKIVEVLRNNGLNVNWNGDVNHKIEISPIVWNHVYDPEETKFYFSRSYYVILDALGNTQ